MEADSAGTDSVCGALVSALLASLRDVEELLAERGLAADDTTIWRWVQRYGPELEQRLVVISTDQPILAG